MSQPVQRKPLPPSNEIGSTQVPQRVSSIKARTQITSNDRPSSMEAAAPPRGDVEGVQDMEYLAPLVSRMSLEGSRGSESPDVGYHRAGQLRTPTRTQLSSSSPAQPGSRTLDSDDAVAGAPGGSNSAVSPSAAAGIAFNSRSGHRSKKSSSDKPLPYTPEVGSDPIQAILDDLPAHPGVRQSSARSRAREDSTSSRDRPTRDEIDLPYRGDAGDQPTLPGGVPVPRGIDLNNTEDTTVHTTWAPAATHETIVRNTHEIERREITREIHQHHVYHRVLPIKQVEVLPAKHFVDTQYGLLEIPEKHLPNTATKDVQRRIADSYNGALPNLGEVPGPRQFTARTFEGTEGDYRENVSPSGVFQTERAWVHQPRLETGAKESGQTKSFHLGSSDPGRDGFRRET